MYESKLCHKEVWNYKPGQIKIKSIRNAKYRKKGESGLKNNAKSPVGV